MRTSFVCIPRGDRVDDMCRRRFTLSCLSQKTYMQLASDPTADERLALAVLDYHAHALSSGLRRARAASTSGHSTTRGSC
jgi:hypothetical protein